MKIFLILLSFLIIVTATSGDTFSYTKHPHKKKKTKIENLPNWTIRKSLIVNSKSEPKNELIKTLIDKLEAEDTFGAKVTKAEFLSIFNKKQSREVYKDKLIRYATPKSQIIQKTEHDNHANYLLRQDKITEGVNFLNKYSAVLDKTESKYNIYKQDLVSILMWESGLGKYSGSSRVFNIFMAQILFMDATQKFAVDKIIKTEGVNPFSDTSFMKEEHKRLLHRQIYAVEGLAALLRYCKKENIDPLNQIGSWGGAIGYVQFMPFNLQYAVDSDSNGIIDLNKWPDAINSVANYLRIKGNYSKDDKGRRAAIFQYNHSDEYVEGVIRYADEIYKAHQNPSKGTNPIK
jgi:membrane-bound lytic murein transglycosylase B